MNAGQAFTAMAPGGEDYELVITCQKCVDGFLGSGEQIVETPAFVVGVPDHNLTVMRLTAKLAHRVSSFHAHNTRRALACPFLIDLSGVSQQGPSGEVQRQVSEFTNGAVSWCSVRSASSAHSRSESRTWRRNSTSSSGCSANVRLYGGEVDRRQFVFFCGAVGWTNFGQLRLTQTARSDGHL